MKNLEQDILKQISSLFLEKFLTTKLSIFLGKQFTKTKTDLHYSWFWPGKTIQNFGFFVVFFIENRIYNRVTLSEHWKASGNENLASKKFDFNVYPW